MKLLIASLVVLLLGCGGKDGTDGTNGSDANVTVTLPEPIVIAPEIPTYQEVNNTICTFKGSVDGFGGEIETKCTLLTNEGQTNFLIVHYIDGKGYNTLFPTVFETNNLLYVNDVLYVPINTSDDNVTNRIEVNYFNADKTIVVGSTEFTQTNIEDNLEITVNVESINNIENTVDVNNTLIIDTNATI